jgi:transposase
MTENATCARVLGCDVGKDTIVIFDSLTGATQMVDNTLKALARVLAGFGRDTFVVCEATGGFETALLSAATALGMPAHRGDPRKTSAFLRSLRSHGKTDNLDAHGLTRYGLERQAELPLWQPPAKTHEALQQLVRLRADLVADRANYARRLAAPGSGVDKRHIRGVIRSFERRIEAVEADIAAQVEADDQLRRIVKLIQHIPGCGPVTAVMLVALMPELGQLSRRQAAALVGLAPHPRQSGKADGYRSVRGGRRDIRAVLFMAAMSARQHNPDLKAFYLRLIEAGKKPLVAIIAVARKLITIINAKVRDAQLQPIEHLS